MLSKKQKRVAGAWFEGKLSVAEILEEYRLSSIILERWMGRQDFQEELERQRKLREQEAQYTLCRYGPLAALKLAELMGSNKEEVARRAALDLIDRCLPGRRYRDQESPEEQGPESLISEEQTREMLMALAEGVKEGEEGKKSGKWECEPGIEEKNKSAD